MKINYNFCKSFTIIVLLLFTKTVFSQNVGISSSSSFTPDASAGLDLSYSSKGLLIPRVALTATNAAGPIASPATSLLVYNTATAGTAPNNVTPGYYYWNGSAWTMLTTSAQVNNTAWTLNGNSATIPTTNFLGTIDNKPMRFRTYNTQRMVLDSLGNVGIGASPTFSTNMEKLLVDAGTTSSFTVISGKGNLNNYLQLNIQNLNAGTAASSDVVATADNGNESVNYVDLGINSSANNANFYGGANDAYLYATGNTNSTVGGNFYIGTSTSSKNLGFLTGGSAIGTPATGTTAAAANNERLHIDGASGYVGLNNPSPSQVLDVTGNMKFSGALMPNNTAGTAGYFLVSSGANVAPTWFNASPYVSTLAWSLAGNSGTTPTTNFLGTTDNKPMRFRTVNAQRMLLDSLGNVGIGTSPTFSTSNREKLLVDAGTTSSFNVISGKGNLNSYLQLNIQNSNAGTGASSDVVATADDGNESNYYVDMGINSSANTANLFGGIHDAYLYNAGGTAAGGNFYIGTSTAAKSLGFLTGGSGVATTSNGTTTMNNERLRIDGTSGNVGINTITPGQKLDVNGTIVSSTATYPNYAYNTANRMAFGETSVPPNESGSVVQYGSGSNSRNMLFAFTKTSVNTSFFGNDGNQTMIGSEGTSNPITFKTGLVYNDANIMTTGSEWMRITATGMVGIGTTAPAQKLDVTGSINASTSIISQGSVLTDAASANTGSSLQPGLLLGGAGTGEGITSKRNTGTNQYGVDIYTNGNLQMTVTNAGNIGMGTISPNSKLTVNGTITPLTNSTGGNLGSTTYRWGTLFSVNAVNTSSDRRLKTNIKDLKYGLKEALALQPVSYNWKDKSQPKNQIGLIAQDVRKIIPEVVVGNEAKETLGISYSELIPVLINAIKEQQKQIDDLRKAVQKIRK